MLINLPETMLNRNPACFVGLSLKLSRIAAKIIFDNPPTIIATCSVLVLVIYLSLANTAHSMDRENDEILMPAWFWDTPVVANCQLAVGYSRAFRDSKTAYNIAFRDGVMRLYANQISTVSGGRGYSTIPGGKVQMGSFFSREVDSTLIPQFLENAVMLDSFYTRELRVVLVGTRSIAVERTLKPCPDDPQSLDDYTQIIRVSAPFYHHLSTSWKQAEEKGIQELAMSGAVEIKGMDLSKDDATFSVGNLETDVTLDGVQTVHRRVDRQNKIVSIWIQGRVTPSKNTDTKE